MITDHFLVSCRLHITDINYMAPRYRPGITIVPATKDRFTNNLPDLSQLLCVPRNQAFCVSSGRPRSQAPLLADWRNSNPAPIS